MGWKTNFKQISNNGLFSINSSKIWAGIQKSKNNGHKYINILC